jgi:type VI protein secretion system component Hcp
MTQKLDNNVSSNRQATNENIRELTAGELDIVVGGKLLDAATPKLHEAACKGTHIPEVVIEVW